MSPGFDVLASYGPFTLGWTIGWLLLWRNRPLPGGAERRSSAAVVIPARNEVAALPHLVPPLAATMRPGDELIVVDDHSNDGTGATAAAMGARVIDPPPLPGGWLGKPHACWHGAVMTTAPLLVFVDADVHPPADLVDRLAAATESHPGEVVSVQPWHVPQRAVEHLSVVFNVAALMGVGTFSVLGPRTTSRAAFGPVFAVDRTTYEHAGGHAAPTVRSRHTEDIALARAVGAAQLYTGRPDVAFRMYPDGFWDLVRGWTRSIATGAGAGPHWATFGTAAWVWSLAAGWLVAWWLYPLCAVQLWVLGRKAGRFSPLVAALYPIAVAVFVVVVLRSAIAVALRRDVVWKSRSVAAR